MEVLYDAAKPFQLDSEQSLSLRQLIISPSTGLGNMDIPTDSITAGNVLKIVNSLHNDGQASFRFGTAQTPLSGKQCLVYAVTFPDEITWAVRIPVHESHLPWEELSGTVEHGVSILKRLKRGGFT
jgi:hypothetical protein